MKTRLAGVSVFVVFVLAGCGLSSAVKNQLAACAASTAKALAAYQAVPATAWTAANAANQSDVSAYSGSLGAGLGSQALALAKYVSLAAKGGSFGAADLAVLNGAVDTANQRVVNLHAMRGFLANPTAVDPLIAALQANATAFTVLQGLIAPKMTSAAVPAGGAVVLLFGLMLMLGTRASGVDAALQNVVAALKKAGIDFVQANIADFSQLTAQEIQSVWDNAIAEKVTVAGLPANPQPADIAANEAALAANDAQLATVATVSEAKAAQIAALKSRAIVAVESVLKTLGATALNLIAPGAGAVVTAVANVL